MLDLSLLDIGVPWAKGVPPLRVPMPPAPEGVPLRCKLNSLHHAIALSLAQGVPSASKGVPQALQDMFREL